MPVSGRRRRAAAVRLRRRPACTRSPASAIPQRFFRDLRARGLTLIEHPFADHHALTAAELDFGDDLPVLMTEKDAVKCQAYADARLWYVPVAARFSEAHARQLLAGVRAKTGDLSGRRELSADGCPPAGNSRLPGLQGHAQISARRRRLLVCRMDRLAYPIRDEVPVMLEEEARQLAADDPLLDR